MGRSTRKKKPTQEKFEPLVTAPFVSVASRVSHMLRGLLKGSLQKMGQLFSHEESRSTNVATFLALLELIRAGRVKVDDSGHLAAGPHTPQKKGQNAMTERQELGSLEAMLFAHAEPVETARLADALRLDADEVTTLLQKLQKRYDEQESGMVILYFEPDRWQMTTRRTTARWSSAFWTPAAMRRFRPPHWRYWPSSPTISPSPAALSSRYAALTRRPPSPSCWTRD